jgi:hypothetical protein
VRSGAEILPVVIKCSPPDHLSKHKPWYWVPKKRPAYSIQLQPRLSQESLNGSADNLRESTHNLNAALKAYFEAKLA